ncbi:hypothetical protein [Streptosporangium roseum]|uniref:hypothetical protein n=1 Tax=Streptosporangium roseum TaxID=2001 RepID=UPI00068EFAAE|nr:hypothetical protein [Streptosporangium roseum]
MAEPWSGFPEEPDTGPGFLAPLGRPLQVAVAVRVASDLGDAAVLGLSLPAGETRIKAVVVALGRRALCALSMLGARRR